jgi:hypothetical protein
VAAFLGSQHVLATVRATEPANYLRVAAVLDECRDQAEVPGGFDAEENAEKGAGHDPTMPPWRARNRYRTLQALMGHCSIANTVVYTAVADKRIGNIWGK